VTDKIQLHILKPSMLSVVMWHHCLLMTYISLRNATQHRLSLQRKLRKTDILYLKFHTSMLSCA